MNSHRDFEWLSHFINLIKINMQVTSCSIEIQRWHQKAITMNSGKLRLSNILLKLILSLLILEDTRKSVFLFKGVT